jgi:hypothetical protein
MKRLVITSIATFILGFFIGAVTLYFAFGHRQTQIIEQSYSGSLVDRILIASKLRTGGDKAVLSDSDFLIERGVTAVDQIAHGTKATQHALQLAKAYYDYHALPIPDRAQTILAGVDPMPTKSFEGLRDLQLTATK